MLYSTRVSYDASRLDPERGEAYVRRAAARAFPETGGFDHATMRVYSPGENQVLQNGQIFRSVLVDCRGTGPA